MSNACLMRLTWLKGKTTDKALAAVAAAAADAAAKLEAARLAANKAFSGEPLKGVGVKSGACSGMLPGVIQRK